MDGSSLCIKRFVVVYILWFRWKIFLKGSPAEAGKVIRRPDYDN